MADEVRDRREKDWTWFNDVIVDHYGPIIGAYGVAVYMVIARHSNVETQDAFPSHDTIAKKLNISKATVKRSISMLKQEKLIGVKLRRTQSGDPDSNIYTLLQPWGGVYRNPPQKTHDEPVSTDDEEVGSIGTQVGSDRPQGGFSQNPGVGSVGATNKTQLEQDSVNKIQERESEKIDSLSSSSVSSHNTAETNQGDDDLLLTPPPDVSKHKQKLPKSQLPGELHQNTVEAVRSMMVTRFHLLAEPTKDNEIFWDSQIAYILEANVISFTTCLKKVDAYWSSDPKGVAMKAPGLRKQMRRGIEIEVEKAQRNTRGHRSYA